MKAFVDTNIILDVLLKREGYVEAAKVLLAGGQDKGMLCTSVLSMANVVYILRKKLQGNALYVELGKLSKFVIPVGLSAEDYEQALQLKAKDFEDALQYFCALSNECTAIITRNKKDFKYSTIKVLSPEEFLRGFVSVQK